MNIPLKKGCDSSGLYGHYVCVYSINLNTGTVGISDCNYNSEYGKNIQQLWRMLWMLCTEVMGQIT